MRLRYVLHVIILALSTDLAFAADGKATYSNYRQIIDNQAEDTMARNRKGQEYLRSLSTDDFMAFVREVAKQPGYDDQKEGHLLAMAVFAKNYMTGPGRTEVLRGILKQFSDPTLPSAWKIGLLDVLNLENRADLSEEELSQVIAALSGMGQAKPASDIFRCVSLQKLGSVLFTQREILIQKAPALKGAIEKQDLTVLPRRDDANVRQAAKLIDAIGDYKMALQETANEVKDEQVKANLKKRLSKWQPVPDTPTK